MGHEETTQQARPPLLLRCDNCKVELNNVATGILLVVGSEGVKTICEKCKPVMLALGYTHAATARLI